MLCECGPRRGQGRCLVCPDKPTSLAWTQSTGFVKFKHLLRKAAARSAETICVIIGEILRAFTPTECANYFRNSRYAQSQKHHALVFVRLAHDRRLVAAVLFVLFLFVLVLFVFIRISGRHRVAHDHERLQSINLVENSSGMCGVMLLLLGCGELGFGPPDAHAVIPGG